MESIQLDLDCKGHNQWTVLSFAERTNYYSVFNRRHTKNNAFNKTNRVQQWMAYNVTDF